MLSQDLSFRWVLKEFMLFSALRSCARLFQYCDPLNWVVVFQPKSVFTEARCSLLEFLSSVIH